jgi:membrane-bound ClpP family serine protease
MALNTYGVSDVVRGQITITHAELERAMSADVLTFVGPILPGLEGVVRTAIEAIEGGGDTRGAKLAVVLDTPGGVVEVVERMVDTIRHHYNNVAFIIPDRAMSAGTVFALSGDSIWMDYHSVLGPIDPQMPNKDGALIPALAYLIQYKELQKRAAAGKLTTAEMVLLQKLDLAELQAFEDAAELSVSLLTEWLVRYKFKDWQTTQTRNRVVTMPMKERRAKAIARLLADPQRWHSHGRGIPMKVLQGSELKLQIDDFGARSDLSPKVHQYFRIVREFMQQQKYRNFVQTRKFL